MTFQHDDTITPEPIIIHGSYNLTGALTLQVGRTDGSGNTGALEMDNGFIGTGPLTKTGANTLYLNGSSSFNGGLTVAQGTVVIPSMNAANNAGALAPTAASRWVPPATARRL